MLKYHNIPVVINGRRFSSKKEGARYRELLLLERAGKITQLECQPRFELLEKFTQGGVNYRSIVYVSDFKYYDIEQKVFVVEDVKGVKTDVFKIKEKLFRFKYPQYRFIVK